MTDVALPRLYERDIDVLLQEELLFNPHVVKIFAQKLSLNAVQIESCQLSVNTDSGETDVLATFTDASRRGYILIENKIDAEFQPDQPARYRMRVDQTRGVDKSYLAFAALVAPSGYIDPDSEQLPFFDAFISYEELEQAIKSDGTPRSFHRAALIRRAFEDARKSYVQVPSEDVTNLWKRIYEIASQEFKKLAMKPPGTKGASSDWVLLKGNLPPKVTLDWKIRKAVVDLSFWRSAPMRADAGTDISALDGAIFSQISSDTSVIRLGVDAPSNPWTAISDAQIREALAAAERLHTFFNEKVMDKT